MAVCGGGARAQETLPDLYRVHGRTPLKHHQHGRDGPDGPEEYLAASYPRSTRHLPDGRRIPRMLLVAAHTTPTVFSGVNQ